MIRTMVALSRRLQVPISGVDSLSTISEGMGASSLLHLLLNGTLTSRPGVVKAHLSDRPFQAIHRPDRVVVLSK